MHKVKILLVEPVTHDVKRFIVEKPSGYTFIPGQATDVGLDQPGWENKVQPFSFTSLASDLVLEFNIKTYPVHLHPHHSGFTHQLHQLTAGDYLLLGDPYGTIAYHHPGVFIAAGAGITPFISIIKTLSATNQLAGHKLIFSNKTKQDIIYEKEWEALFPPSDRVFTLTREHLPGYASGRIDAALLHHHLADFAQFFYLCGPKQFVASLKSTLTDLGAASDSIIFEH